MSSKPQLNPLSSTVAPGWPTPRTWGSPTAKPEEMKFLRSWLVYDSENQERLVTTRRGRSMALGLALAFSLSASFWTVFALAIARHWK